MSMNTMTLIDDYVDALLDGGALDAGVGHGRGDRHDGDHHGAHFDASAGRASIGLPMQDGAADGGTNDDGLLLDGSLHDDLSQQRPSAPPALVLAASPLDSSDDDDDAGMAMAMAMAASAAACPHDGDFASALAPVVAAEPRPAPAFVPAFVPTVAPPPAATPATTFGSARAAPDAQITPKAASHRWLRVTVGDDSYALELLRVQEVVRLAPIVALRGAARAVLGVMNLRGRIVPVLDLGLWLQAGCVHGDERSRIVVVERDDEMIGMLVSAVEDVVTLGRDRIEPPLPSSDPGAIVGIARVGAAPTVLLDANALFG